MSYLSKFEQKTAYLSWNIHHHITINLTVLQSMTQEFIYLFGLTLPIPIKCN
jgi:hypothetical protein